MIEIRKLFLKGKQSMNINVEMIPQNKILYIRKTGPYGTGNITTMEALKSWARTNHLLNDDSVILGIVHDDPQITEPEECRYDACLIVSDDFKIQDDSIQIGTINGGKYAVFIIEHTQEALQKAWNEIIPELYIQGYRMDTTRPVIERYAARMVKNHECEICIPVY
jgi:DNA gyrase inhibitor GyrI